MARSSVTSALVVAAVLGAVACGGGTKVPKVAKPKAPAVGQPSAKFGLPLPKGAVADPASAGAGEAYRVAKVTVLDVNAFYQKQSDGKPLQGFAWCGGAAFSATEIVRIWKKAPKDQLKLDLTSDPKGVLIRVSEDAKAPVTPCPPSPPNTGQPFEGP